MVYDSTCGTKRTIHHGTRVLEFISEFWRCTLHTKKKNKTQSDRCPKSACGSIIQVPPDSNTQKGFFFSKIGDVSDVQWARPLSSLSNSWPHAYYSPILSLFLSFFNTVALTAYQATSRPFPMTWPPSITQNKSKKRKRILSTSTLNHLSTRSLR